MRYIGPHKYISYINPDNTDEDKHMGYLLKIGVKQLKSC